MTLNLTANGAEQTVIKAYLEQNASDILAEKINNGVIVEQDGKKLINRKTLDGFMRYAAEQARKQAEKGATSACIQDSVVFGWAIHYFEEESIIGTLYNEDGSEYQKLKPAPKSESKNTGDVKFIAPIIIKPKETAGQMSLFDFADDSADKAEIQPVTKDVFPDNEEHIAEVKTHSERKTTTIQIDVETGEVIDGTAHLTVSTDKEDNPYSDTELLSKIYALLDFKAEIVR